MNIQELYDNGTIKFLYNRGMISIDVLCYFEYVQYYRERRSAGSNYTNAILDTAEKYQISTSTVKRALRTLK
jgi:hypothetical protein